MKINLITIGKLKEKFLIEGVSEYIKRIKIYAKIEVKEILECKTVEEEGKKLLAQIHKESFVIVLDVGGEELNSEEFAKKLDELTLRGKSNITFIIGGAFGISEEVKNVANFRLSLSKMTFTHQIARFLIVEQIYRAFKINRGENYHH